MREAPSLVLIEQLCNAGARVHAYDPVAMKEAQKNLPKGCEVKFFDAAYDALQNADALVVVTEWNEFRNPDFNRIKSQLKNPVIFDGRNIFCSRNDG